MSLRSGWIALCSTVVLLGAGCLSEPAFNGEDTRSADDADTAHVADTTPLDTTHGPPPDSGGADSSPPDTAPADARAVDTRAVDTRSEDTDETDADGTDSGCVPSNGGNEICDRTDNDCDGTIDEIKNCRFTALLGGPNDERAADLAIDDATGDIFFVGTASGDIGQASSNGGNDILVGRTDEAGHLKWLRLLGSSADDAGHSIAIDSDEHAIFVTGQAGGRIDGEVHNGDADLVVAKFKMSGTTTWVELLGTQNFDSGFQVIAADSTRSLYVVGQTGGSLGGEPYEGLGDGFLARYDYSGSNAWVRTLGTGTQEDLHAVAYDSRQKKIYAAGYHGGSGHGNEVQTLTPGEPVRRAVVYDIFAVRFSQDGSRDWLGHFPTVVSGQHMQKANGMTWNDSEQALYIAGYSEDFAGGPKSGILLKVTDTGDLDWYELLPSNTDEDLIFEDVSTTGDEVVAVGRTSGAVGNFRPNGGSDGVISHFGTDGRLSSTELLGGPRTDRIQVTAPTSDGDRIVISGESGGDLNGQKTAGGADVLLHRIQ